jgi:hypothetical protein
MAAYLHARNVQNLTASILLNVMVGSPALISSYSTTSGTIKEQTTPIDDLWFADLFPPAGFNKTQEMLAGRENVSAIMTMRLQRACMRN